MGNSKVEEHISRQAFTDVFQLQQHSQDPANLTEHKMEVHTKHITLRPVVYYTFPGSPDSRTAWEQGLAMVDTNLMF